MGKNRVRVRRMRRIPRFLWATMACMLGAVLVFPAEAAAQPPPGTGGRQAEFAAAAAEFTVPDSVLLAVSYQETLWESHSGGQPSTTGRGAAQHHRPVRPDGPDEDARGRGRRQG